MTMSNSPKGRRSDRVPCLLFAHVIAMSSRVPGHNASQIGVNDAIVQAVAAVDIDTGKPALNYRLSRISTPLGDKRNSLGQSDLAPLL